MSIRWDLAWADEQIRSLISAETLRGWDETTWDAARESIIRQRRADDVALRSTRKTSADRADEIARLRAALSTLVLLDEETADDERPGYDDRREAAMARAREALGLRRR